MRNLLLIVLLIGICIAGAAYYTYSTNPEFAYMVDDLLKKGNPVNADTVQFNKEAQSTKPQSHHPRIKKSFKPDKFFKIDEFARKTPKQYERDIATLANYLASAADSDNEKVRSLFTWVATHICYDAEAFNSGNLGQYPAESVLLSKKAVCAGYSNLFKELCLAAGFKCERVSGYSKGFGYTEGQKFEKLDHAWNVVKIGDQWKLVDPTWASGYGVNKRGKMVAVKEFDAYWFDVKPKEFIFTHLPENSEWQLIKDPIDLDRYEELPYLDKTFFKIGFDVDKVFEDAVYGNVRNFVMTYSVEHPFKSIQMPFKRDLNEGDSIKFMVESDYYEFILLADRHGWKFFKQNGNIFELTYVPIGGPISIQWSTPSLTRHTILEYQTAKN